MSIIRVRWGRSSLGPQRYQDCDNWYDFADWLKQTTMKHPVIIFNWYYVERTWEFVDV